MGQGRILRMIDPTPADFKLITCTDLADFWREAFSRKSIGHRTEHCTSIRLRAIGFLDHTCLEWVTIPVHRVPFSDVSAPSDTTPEKWSVFCRYVRTSAGRDKLFGRPLADS